MKKVSEIQSFIIYDIRYSFCKNKYKWYLALIILAFLAYRSIDIVRYYGFAPDMLSVSWPTMSGAREYALTSDRSFDLPAYWFLFHIYLAFLIGFYVLDELHFGNGQAITRTYSRKIWLLSKLLSVVVNVLIYYACFFLFLTLGTILFGGSVFPASGMIGIAGIMVGGKAVAEVIVEFWLLPMLVSITLSVIQVIASLFLSPVLSFLYVIGYLIASVFWTNPLFIGNYAMILRQNWISEKTSMTDSFGILICITLIIIAVFSGMYLFPQKDILSED